MLIAEAINDLLYKFLLARGARRRLF
jgi:hypothetical protein